MAKRAVTDDDILDGALRCVMDFGVRRTTLTDVARLANISRVTLYRRFPDLNSVLSALMTREFSAVDAEAQKAAAGAGSERERVVTAAIVGARLLSEHPLLRRIVDVDPELLLPYLTRRLGQFQLRILAETEEELRIGMAEGSVREGDPAAMATTIELALRGFVIGAQSQTATARKRTLAELQEMIGRYLAPTG